MDSVPLLVDCTHHENAPRQEFESEPACWRTYQSSRSA